MLLRAVLLRAVLVRPMAGTIARRRTLPFEVTRPRATVLAAFGATLGRSAAGNAIAIGITRTTAATTPATPATTSATLAALATSETRFVRAAGTRR
jgi:hypothetical protein